MLLSYFAYLALVVFVAVIIYRIYRIATTPVHLRWELYPVMHEGGGKAEYGGSYLEELNWWTKRTQSSKVSEISFMVPEILFLKGVWEANRGLWFWSWAFHFALYCIIGTTGLVVVSAILGAGSSLGGTLLAIAGYIDIAAGILGVIGSLGMLFKRAFDNNLNSFASVGTYFNLLFIGAIFATGLYAIQSLGAAAFMEESRAFITGLVTFNPAVVSGPASLNFIVALAFVIYIPFTHMAHFCLKWFTWHEVRWNDTPNKKGSKMEEEIGKALSYKPTWAARHIKADGNKTWVDIATEEIEKND